MREAGLNVSGTNNLADPRVAMEEEERKVGVCLCRVHSQLHQLFSLQDTVATFYPCLGRVSKLEMLKHKIDRELCYSIFEHLIVTDWKQSVQIKFFSEPRAHDKNGIDL